MELKLHWADVSGMKRLENALGRLDGPQKRLVLQRAVNRAGDSARGKVVRALVSQTGLPFKVLQKAVKAKRASGVYQESGTRQIFVTTGSSVVYEMSSTGGDISLKFFKPVETLKGVSAVPGGQRKLFERSFMRGGRFPNRKPAKGLNGHVWRRDGKDRLPLEFVDSGVIIPVEMLRGESAAVFRSTVDDVLPRRVMHEVEYLCQGIFR